MSAWKDPFPQRGMLALAASVFGHDSFAVRKRESIARLRGKEELREACARPLIPAKERVR